MADDAPATDARHPADVVAAMVEHVLGLASTWTRWDGTPTVVPVEDEPPRTYTPHKAVRRVADHLLDHLAEVEARLAGQPTVPDHWHGSMVTTPADLATFTADDWTRPSAGCGGWPCSGSCGCDHNRPSGSTSPRTALDAPAGGVPRRRVGLLCRCGG